MLQKILVPLDGSPQSDRALEVFEPLLVRPEAEVLLVSVIPGKPGKGEEEDGRLAALAYLRGAEARLRARGARVTCRVLVGTDAAREILSFGDSEGASLVCMSTHGRTGVRRLVLGSVAEKVLRTSRAPVLLATHGSLQANRQPIDLRRVLVALDGSERAEQALPLAAELARSFGAEVSLLHVEERTALDPLVAVAESRRRSERTLARARETLPGASVRTLARAGAPAAEIVEAVALESPDLVIMTTHGRTGLARLALGSVAETVLRRAGCPVLVKRSVPSENAVETRAEAAASS